MIDNEKNKQTNGQTGFFEQYWRYASSLRDWLVVYGVGGIVLVFKEDALFDNAGRDNLVSVIIGSFLIAVAAQIVMAFIRKWIHWFIYYGQAENRTETRWYDHIVHLSKWVWLDIVADIVSLTAFAVAGFLFVTASS